MSENRVDRRLAAILAGDIAGYSRLMSVDEEGTLRQLPSTGAGSSKPPATGCWWNSLVLSMQCGALSTSNAA
jgi:hypothetical protein